MKKLIKKYCILSVKDFFIFIATFLCTSTLCIFLQGISNSDFHVPMIFVLAVLIISLATEGYFYGSLAAFMSVFAVNWAFTYPYFKMDFSLYGYPLTFITMLAVGIATSTLTSRVKEQEKLRHESEQEKMRANLLRAISHDLRTPLTSISGSIGAVLENDNSLSIEEKNELLGEAKKDAEWLCRMVENLLSITRISGEEIGNIRKEHQMLEEVLSEAVVKFKNKNPGIEISVNVPDTLLFVPMDAMLIEQVIINILDNAVCHGVTTSSIKISASFDDEYASISVTDNGQGIDKKTLPHLFDGSLSEDSSTDKTRGMGIGLLVCRTIVQAHGGSISAHNLPEGGARFVFTLKLGGNQNYYQG